MDRAPEVELAAAGGKHVAGDLTILRRWPIQEYVLPELQRAQAHESLQVLSHLKCSLSCLVTSSRLVAEGALTGAMPATCKYYEPLPSHHTCFRRSRRCCMEEEMRDTSHCTGTEREP